MKIDLERCKRAMENLKIDGSPDGERRLERIESAIAGIQERPEETMKNEYFGIKNYASFGDQGADCEYGSSPRHGDIVFSIGRKSRSVEGVKLGADEIYLLECVRDFGGVELDRINPRDGQRETFDGNLTDVIDHLGYYEEKAKKTREIFEKGEVDSHVEATA